MKGPTSYCLFGAIYLGEVTDDEIERILLHVVSLAPVRGLKDLKDILYHYIPLEVGFAEHLEPVIGEDVEMGGGEEI